MPPDHIYVVEYKDLNMKGGDYELLNTSYKCDNYHMFKLKGHQFYIWSAAGSWHSGFDPTPNNVLTPEGIPPLPHSSTPSQPTNHTQ